MGLLLLLFLHDFYEPKHFSRPIIEPIFLVIGHAVLWLKLFAPKLVDLKPAFVHIKMNVSFLKVGRTGLPHLCFGMQGFHCLPCTVADAFAVFLRQHKK